MIWRNLYYSGLRRIFAGVFIVVFISVNTGNFILYAFFSSALTAEIEKASLQMLTKVKNATELMYNEIISLSTQLGHGNITITRLMFEEERDRILEYQSHQIMQNALVSFPYIDYIAVYNERLDEIIATKYFVSETVSELKALANRYFQTGFRNLTIPLSVRHMVTNPDSTVKNTITIIVYSPLSLKDDKGVLLVGVDCDYFQQLIRRLDEGDLETVMILHGNGELITHTEINRQLQDFPEREYLEVIFYNEKDTGFYTTGIKGDKMFVSFTKSVILNWVFVSMAPYKKMAAKLIFLRNLTFILTLLVLCAGLFISYLMAISMYKPVQRILKRFNYIPGKPSKKQAAGRKETGISGNENNNENEFIEKQLDYLSSAAEITEPLIKNAFIVDLLKNHCESNIIGESLANFNNHVISSVFREPYYLVCILSIDEQENEQPDGLINKRNILQKIAAELFKKTSIPVDYISLSSTDIAVVLHLETGAVPGDLVPLIGETGEMAKKFAGFSVSASVGSIVNSIYAINDSFEEAESGLKERFFLGDGIIACKPNMERKELAYPEHAGEQLYQALLLGDTGNIQKVLDMFIGALEKTTYEYARMYLNTIVMQTLYFSLADKLAVDANSFHQLAELLQKTQTLEKVYSLLSKFFLGLAGSIKKDSAGSLPVFIRDVIKMTAEKYHDPLFSINTAAESLNITPAYFNRVFKKYNQISYSEFLNEYRIKKACELLRATNESVIVISSAVGINNATYFYTLFKKIHNTTPQQYRSNIRGSL
jgi:AraC-like DNA-binding protein